MSVNGEEGTQDGASGGSGGSILIRAVNIYGLGNVNAQGGQTAPTGNQFTGGGGGGGRIASYFFTLSSSVRFRTNSVAYYSNDAGGPGTAYFFNNATRFGQLVVNGGSGVDIPDSLVTVPNSLTWISETDVSHYEFDEVVLLDRGMLCFSQSNISYYINIFLVL